MLFNVCFWLVFLVLSLLMLLNVWGVLLVFFCDEGGRRLLVVLNVCRGRRRVLVVVALGLVAVGVFWRSGFFVIWGVSSEG
ncbi:hypothetical protein Hanom_Chr07g00581401 [Helianthus anomalus]